MRHILPISKVIFCYFQMYAMELISANEIIDREITEMYSKIVGAKGGGWNVATCIDCTVQCSAALIGIG